MSLFAPLASSLWTQVQGYGLDAEEYFRMAFTRMSRYARMINDRLTVTLVDEGENLVVTFDAHRPSRHASIREDMQLSIATNCCRALAGNRFHPSLLRFAHAEPVETGYYESLFRCPFEFGAASTSMLIPLEVASQRLAGSNEELAGLNEHIVVRYLAHATKTDIVNRVKAAIIDGLASAGVTELRIADALHMTARNLHRKLHKENTSFKFLLNEVRQELAEQYIRDRSITLTEMSFMLGFSEVSSFSRAYKNWTGKAPSAVRGAVARSH